MLGDVGLSGREASAKTSRRTPAASLKPLTCSLTRDDISFANRTESSAVLAVAARSTSGASGDAVADKPPALTALSRVAPSLPVSRTLGLVAIRAVAWATFIADTPAP